MQENPLLIDKNLTTRVYLWTKNNLFSSRSNTIITFILIYFFYLILPSFFDWALFKANFTGSSKEDCDSYLDGAGACWAFIKVRFSVFLYGFYPAEQRWRVDFGLIYVFMSFIPVALHYILNKYSILLSTTLCAIFAGLIFYLLNQMFIASLLLVFLIALPLMLQKLFSKFTSIVVSLYSWLFLTLPIAAIFFMGGFFYLPPIATDQWGGLFLTLVVAVTGIVFSLPIGILLALGRRSSLSILRILCTTFIEFVRGVPLISVLFMASVMLPLFLPEGVDFNKLLRALIGVALFYSAYMAEIVRGGLQGIDKGQVEGADSLGLTYIQKHRLIILPQALRIVIPGIINTCLGLFKDTTLVAVIGLLDLLGTIKTALADTQWLGYSKEAYIFAALVFWIICYVISLYGRSLERFINKKQKGDFQK